jgi:DNA repair protein RadC
MRALARSLKRNRTTWDIASDCARFLDAGAAALADYELLELVLFRAIPRRDLKPLTKMLLARFGSFAEAISASRERLKEVKGLSDAAIAELKIIEAAAGRLARGQVKERHVLSSWASVLDYCRTVMAYGEREELRVVLFMNMFSFVFNWIRMASLKRPHRVLSVCSSHAPPGEGEQPYSSV